MTENRFPISRREVLGKGAVVGTGALVDVLPNSLVRLDDFLSARQKSAAGQGQAVDCTDAFAKALGEGGRWVGIGPGHYGLAGLRIPNGGGLVGLGGAVLHQISPLTPAIDCLSDKASGQLAGVVVEGVELVGHPAAQVALVRVGARGAYAVWRSRFAWFARNCWRTLEIEGSDSANVFECTFEIVCEGAKDTAVVVTGGAYNRYHLFLSRTEGYSLDDQSGGSEIRLVAENCAIFRGQNNRIYATVEGIFPPRAAAPVAIADQGFGNTFFTPTVNMPERDAGKLAFAFRAFDRTVFVNPQIIGPGAPPDPFAPTLSGLPFTVIDGRSRSTHKMEAVFDGSDENRDLRKVSFVGEVSDFTTLAVRAGRVNLQRLAAGAGVARIAPTTQVVQIGEVGVVTLDMGPLRPPDGWQLEFVAAGPVRLDWSGTARFAGLPPSLAAGERARFIYQAEPDHWVRV